MSDESIAEIKKRIKKLEGIINELNQKLDNYHETLWNKYFDLRKIMEDEKNHEKNLICLPLKPNIKYTMTVIKEMGIIGKIQ